MDERAETILLFGRNRALAHQSLFEHRHPDVTPDFHYDIINVWHSADVYAQVIAFREAAKSTIAEEAIVIQALFKSFRNAILIGENQPRAIDRLAAIKHELVHNEFINDLFGDQVGDTWGAEKIILRNGVVIQALGRRMEVRGMKHLDIRPDILFGDDLESEEHVKDAATRHETLRWLFAEVIPALDKNHRVRIQATPLDVDALPVTLARMPDWYTLKIPIKYRDPETNEWKAAWPGRYPLDWIDAKEESMRSLGLHHEFQREYMCEAEDPAKKVFTPGMFKVVPRARVWQPVWAMYDPARTTNARSSTTGFAAWSWIGNRLVVWDGDGLSLKPDEIVAHMFDFANTYNPVAIGVEQDGLEEFLMQPIRLEMVKRAHMLPIEPMRAPKGKLDFIAGLQPLFNAGEVEFATALPGLVAQFLSYPTGKIDGPNALAYAIRLRPGLPFYENFSNSHVSPDLLRFEREPCWLAVNATAGVTTAVLMQQVRGTLHVLADWVMEGDPGATLSDIVRNARLEIGAGKEDKLRLIAPGSHWSAYSAVGLRGAAALALVELRKGGDELTGREVIRGYLKQHVKDTPAFRVAVSARWTLNALAAGYCREITKAGMVKETAKPGIYAVLMEGVEAFAALLKAGILSDDQPANWAYTATGVAYKTSLPQQQGSHETKSNFLRPDDNITTGSVLRRR
jgi:hypothetical protein